MDLIIGADTVPASGRDVVPSTGTPQWATDGNPSASPSIPATDFPAYHYNMVIGELYNLVLAAGLTPSGTSWEQVRIAAQKMGLVAPYSSSFSAEIGGYPQYAIVEYGGVYYSSNSAANTTVPGTSGSAWTLLFQGLATQSFVKGTVSLGETGYEIRPNGVIEQWGKYTTDSSGLLTVVFPIPFPNACFNVGLNEANASGTWINNTPTAHGVQQAPNTAGVAVNVRIWDATNKVWGPGAASGYWRAKGN